MLTWRTVLAAAAIATAPTYLLLAQPGPPGNEPIGILLAAGDVSHCEPSEHAATAAKTAMVIMAQIEKAAKKNPPVPVHVLALGDLAYDVGTPEQLECFKQRWGAFYDVLLPVPGNHEYYGNQQDAKDYFDHFIDHPLVNQNGAMKGYYMLNFPDANGPWRLFALNAQAGWRGKKKDPQHAKAMAAQMTWLRKNVDPAKPENNQNCVLAFWHPPLFSSGYHGHGGKKKEDALVTTDRTMERAFGILYRYGATVVVAGHDHNYEQFTPHNEKGEAKKDGLRSFVVGTGGTKLRNEVKYKNPAPNSEDYNQETHGVLKLELFADHYRWEFLPVDDKPPLTLTTQKANCNPRKKG